MNVTREAMARAQQEAWTHAKNPGGTARGMFNAGWDAALALVRGEQHAAENAVMKAEHAERNWQQAWREAQQRAEAAERALATMTPTEAYDTVYAALEAAERERDRQYDFNVEQIAKQAALEAQLQALQRALHSLAKREHCWCDTSPGPHAPITHTTRCLSVRAALASPAAP